MHLLFQGRYCQAAPYGRISTRSNRVLTDPFLKPGVSKARRPRFDVPDIDSDISWRLPLEKLGTSCKVALSVDIGEVCYG